MRKPANPSRPAISGKDAAPPWVWGLTSIVLGIAAAGVVLRAILS